MADKLTDSELRQELSSLGVTAGPITGTTRNLYVKKLNKLWAENKQKVPASRGRKSGAKLQSFSSDEDEEAGSSTSTQRKSKTTRQTGARREQAPARRESPKRASSTKQPAKRSAKVVNETSVSTRSRPTSRNTPAPKTGPGTKTTVTRRTSLGRVNITYSFDNKGDEFNSSDSERDDVDAGEDDDNENEENDASLHDMGTNTSPALDSSSMSFNRTFTRPSSAFSSANESAGLGPSRGTTPRTSTPEKKTQSRVSVRPSGDTAIRHTNITPRGYSSVSTYRKTNTSVADSRRRFPLYENNVRKDREEQKFLQQGFKTKEDTSGYKWSQYISMVVLITAAIFFVALFCMYIGVKIGSAETEEVTSKDNLMICNDTLIEQKQGKCFKKEDVDFALEAIHYLHHKLSKAKGDIICEYETEYTDGRMSRGQVEQILSEAFGQGNYKLDIILELIIANEHWGIQLFGAKDSIPVTTARDVHWLEAIEPSMSVVCRLRRAVMLVIYQIIVAATVVVVCAIGVAYVKYRKKQQEKEKLEVYAMVEQILDILKDHQDNCQTDKALKPYLAIPHVRDMLIPPAQRRKQQHIWDKAVKFLAANESRIREETQVISGEEFAVWRWIQGFPAVTKGKVWQGQAFGEGNASMNFPAHSPTQCLKIRSMFDSEIECEPNWHVRIEDAILEKCEGIQGILHLSVDKNSKEGCVYMKCSSSEVAGQAFRALHGWWFDGNLITVKYLRLERYHERFPEAANCHTPLSPSNTNKHSVSQPYYRSLLERT